MRWLDEVKKELAEQRVEFNDCEIANEHLDRLIEIAERAQALVSVFESGELLPGEYDDLVYALSDEWVKP